MSNPLYKAFGPAPSPQLQNFQQFMQSFRGNAREQVQQLLNSGRVSQQQYDEAVRRANELAQMFGK